jgi:hypothetical protein
MRAKGNPFDPTDVLGCYDWFNNASGTSMQMKDGALLHNEVAYFYRLGEGHFRASYSNLKFVAGPQRPVVEIAPRQRLF